MRSLAGHSDQWALGRPAFRLRLRVSGGAWAACLLWVSAAWGQVQVSLRLEYPSALQYEPVLASVTIHNDSDHVLSIPPLRDEEVPELVFAIQREGDFPVPRVDHRPLIRQLRIQPDEEEETLLDIGGSYNLVPMGRYLVQAVVRWRGARYESNKEMIDVVAGVEVQRVTRTLSGYPDAARVYSLRYWSRGRGQHLFLRVDDDADRVSYGLFPLGPYVPVFRPVLDVTRDGRVSVIHQSGIHRYSRSILKAEGDGVRMVDQTYHRADGSPYPSGVQAAAPALPASTPPPPKRPWWRRLGKSAE